jgi:hypothetical protein
MSAIGILFVFLLKVLFFGLLFLLFILIIRRKSQGKKTLPFLIVFMSLVVFGIYVYSGMKSRENEAAKAFIKEYKLTRLDGKHCINCVVKVNDNHHYDIIENSKIIGKGKWNMDFESDAGFYFIRLENGPLHIIGEKDSVIEYIDRTTK